MNDQLKENVELAKSSDSFLFDNARIRPYRRFMNRIRLGEWHCCDIAVELPFLKSVRGFTKKIGTP